MSIGQTFTDVAASNGITGECGFCHFGAGVSFIDFNHDGFDDLTFTTATGVNVKFYQNNAGAGFTEIAAPITNTGDTKAVIWIDYDNDGDYDLYITTYLGQNRLYENDGTFTFTDITTTAGFPTVDDPTYGATWGDYNQDGDLDVYISNYTSGSTGDASTENFLFENNGDGTFTDVTTSTGTTDAGKPSFCSAFFDINNNTEQDLYISSDRDSKQNTLFKNGGGGVMTDISVSSGTNISIDAMNTGIGDYNEDGYLDIYVTNTEGGNALLENNGDETFTDVASAAGVELNKISWGGQFFDADNDLDLDLYVCVMHEGSAYANNLYINDFATHTFSSLPNANLIGDPLSSQSCAIGDFNNDGKADIAVNNSLHGQNTTKSDFALWQNNTSNANNWVKMSLTGVTSNIAGIGSRIEFLVNGNWYTRYVHCGISYLAQNSSSLILGIGTNASIQTLRISWPSGVVDIHNNIAAGSIINAVENAGVLPVTWKSFTAEPTQQQSIQIEWATASAYNNKGFSLQRSDDGVSFNEITWFDGKGNTSSGNNYLYEDSDLIYNHLYYYRLVQHDFDGHTKVSQIVNAEVKSTLASLSQFYPNPTGSGNVFIKVHSQRPSHVHFSIQNALKQLVHEHQVEVTSKNAVVQMDVSTLTPGIYFVKIEMGKKTWIRKLFVQ